MIIITHWYILAVKKLKKNYYSTFFSFGSIFQISIPWTLLWAPRHWVTCSFSKRVGSGTCLHQTMGQFSHGNCLGHWAFLLGHQVIFRNVKNSLMVFSIINNRRSFSFLQHHSFTKSLSLSVSCSIKCGFEAYLVSSGIRALLRNIQWILGGFRCKRRRGTRNSLYTVI